uniref:K Homology domain-containing protein n=1 Tax=Amblyomma parvum TaxID=251391 RepID=A0A023FZE5_AMBPA
MDVLNCELLWIDGSCYRKLTPISRFSLSEDVDVEDKISDLGCGGGGGGGGGVNTYNDEPTCLAPKVTARQAYEDTCSTLNAYFRRTVYVPQIFLPRLCGKKHAVRKQIEFDTNTEIKVPPPDVCDDVVITGGTEEDVESAHLRISATVNAMRQHEHYTHFVCFPLNLPKLGSTVDEFKEIVLKSCTGRGLDVSLFASKQKLHLTIGMLVLLDSREQSIAQKVLDSCKEFIMNILDDGPLMVRVHGLEIMNDDPGEVDVLYAKVSAFNREGPSRSSEKCKLQQLADGVAQRFLESGLMLRQQDRGRGPEHVKLHMTLMNTRLREQRFATENTSLPPARKPRNSFDATGIMKRNRDFAFGRIHIPSINVVDPHNCDSDGFYKRIATLHLPKQQHS